MKTSPETELNKIQEVIDQHKTYHAVLAALTEWEKDFSVERKQHDQPEYTPEYLRQQRENYDMVKWLGPQVIHSSIYDFGASLSFYSYLSNRQAIIWLQNFIPAKANIPIAIPTPEKPETESQTSNTSTQSKAQPTPIHNLPSQMSELLFTADDLMRYMNNPNLFKIIEPGEKQKVAALRQYIYNEEALHWLRTVFFEPDHPPTETEQHNLKVTIMDAFKWYAVHQQKQYATQQTIETQQLHRDAQRGQTACQAIGMHTTNLKTTLHDHALIQIAEKALVSWNEILPLKTEKKSESTLNPEVEHKIEEYTPSDWVLIGELCNARESNWENAYIGHNRWNQGESSDYGTYLKGVAINLPAIPLLHMLTPTEWREKPLTFIINQIQTSPAEYRNTIKNIIDRYKTAARKKLIDIAYRQWISCSTNSPENTNREKKFKKYSDAPILDNSDIPPPNVRYNAPGKNGEPGEPYNDCTVYDFLGNLFEEAKLVKKVITLQELQKLLEKTQPTYRPEHLTHSTNSRPTNTSEFQPSDREMLIEIKKAVHEFMQDPTAPGIEPSSWDSAYQKYNNRFSIIWNTPPKTGTSLLHDLISN